MCNGWNETFTRGLLRQSWAGKIISKLENSTMKIMESKEQKENMEEKWTGDKGTVKHHHLLWGNSGGTGKWVENIWGNNVWTLPKFEERHKCETSKKLSEIHDKHKPTPGHVMIKLFKDKGRTLKTARKKWLATYKGSSVILSAGFSSELWEAGRQQTETFKIIKGKKNHQPRNLYLAKLFFNSEGEIDITGEKSWGSLLPVELFRKKC